MAEEVIDVSIDDIDLSSIDVPKTDKDFTKDLPADNKSRLGLIAASASFATKTTVQMFWYMGRILEAIIEDKKGLPSVDKIVDKVAYQLNYRKRTLYYARSVYKAFPDFQVIKQMTSLGISSTIIRNLASIRSDEKRKEITDNFLEGKVSVDNLEEEIGKVMTEEKTENESDSNSNSQGDNSDSGEQSGNISQESSGGDDKKKQESKEKLPADYFTGLADILRQWRHGEHVPVDDISAKIQELEKKYDKKDKYLTDAKTSAQEVLDEVEKSFEYYRQLKKVIEDFIGDKKK